MKYVATFLLRKFSTPLLGMAMFLALGPACYAGVFAKYDGIDGESKDKDHDKWIDVLSIDWGAHKPGGGQTGQSRRRGTAIVEDVTLTIEYEKASPKLQEKCLKGEVIPKLEIDVTATYSETGERETYLRYELKDVLITSFQFAANGEGAAALQVSMNFTEIEWTYTDREGNDTHVRVDKRSGDIDLKEEPSAPRPPRG